MQVTCSQRRVWCAGCLMLATIVLCDGAVFTARSAPEDVSFQSGVPGEQPLEFEVISIREAERPTGPPGNSLRTLPGGRFEVNAVTLQAIILWAYELRPYVETLEGSSHLLRRPFTISARAPADIALPDQKGAFRAMARAMLRDRFGLKVSLQQRPREVQVLRQLRTGVLGEGLTRVDGDCVARDSKTGEATPQGLKCGLSYIDGRLTGIVRDMSELTDFLSQITRTSFVDATGLTGKFQISSTSDPRSLLTTRGADAQDYPGSNYDSFNKAIEKQLGLVVRNERMPMNHLVVESVTAPTDN